MNEFLIHPFPSSLPTSLQCKLIYIIQYVEQHIEKSFTVAELAASIDLSPDYFTRVFRSATGVTPCLYIQLCKLENAKILLTTTRLSVNEVAEQVGIFDVSQFCKLFKKHTHYTPKQYRMLRI